MSKFFHNTYNTNSTYLGKLNKCWSKRGAWGSTLKLGVYGAAPSFYRFFSCFISLDAVDRILSLLPGTVPNDLHDMLQKFSLSICQDLSLYKIFNVRFW